jgi:co-chaperonin GroES (HSP10)
MKDNNINPNEWAVLLESEALRANGSRLIVLEDEFRSGYECKDCSGTGHTNIKCKHCKGTKFHKGKEENGSCPDCEVGTSDGRKSFGYELCETCKGQQALVIIPDTAKRRPLTGRVVSAGRACTEFSVGDRVMFTNYTGTDFELKGGVKIRIIMEQDILCEYKSLKKGEKTASTGIIDSELSEAGVSVGNN